MNIKIFTTGGTIDGIEYSEEKSAPIDNKSLINDFFKKANLVVDYSVDVLMQKDSKFINDKDRKFIASNCKEATEGKIILTHGTMTMALTAEFLLKEKINKTIVITGSMVLGTDPKSDAFFNLGAAFIAVQELPIGVFIVMNGKVFRGDNAVKNTEKNIFEEKNHTN